MSKGSESQLELSSNGARKPRATLLDGKWLAARERRILAEEVKIFTEQFGRAPGLATILVGDDKASATYVGSKHRSAQEVGFKTFDSKLPATATSAEIAQEIVKYNSRADVDGILLQLPLPSGLDPNPLLDLIDPNKDADGLHPLNQGLLNRGTAVAKPCTPLGAMLLIDLAFSSQDALVVPRKDLSGLNAVVLGRSILVGKPMGTMLLERNATVTVAHSKTKDLPALCRAADIVVAAVGRARMVRGDWIKPGAVVIDVGINRDAEGKLCGDVDFDSAVNVAGSISPVPGGAGLMTVAMLLRNTFELAKYRCSSR